MYVYTYIYIYIYMIQMYVYMHVYICIYIYMIYRHPDFQHLSFYFLLFCTDDPHVVLETGCAESASALSKTFVSEQPRPIGRGRGHNAAYSTTREWVVAEWVDECVGGCVGERVGEWVNG